MLGRPRLILSLCVLLGLARGLRAAEPAALGTAEIATGGGRDTNMFLQVSPDAATREPQVGGWFARAAPRLVGSLSFDRLRLDLSYALDYRGSAAAGHLATQELELATALVNVGRFRPSVSIGLGRFDASRFAVDRFSFIGGEVGLRVELTTTWRVNAGYRLDWRNYPGRDETALVHLADARLSYRPASRFELGLGSSYFVLTPAATDQGGLRLLRFGPDVELAWDRLSVALSGWAGPIEVTPVGQDMRVGGALTALVRITKNLDLTATFDLTAAPWAADFRAGDYGRRYVGLGMLAHASGRMASVTWWDGNELRPVVRGGRARFRLRAAQATAVQVIGSWDDWSTSGGALGRTREPGLWEAWVVVPPGAHRYRLLVDGRSVRPPDATRYVKDDFGDEDGILEVPGRP